MNSAIGHTNLPRKAENQEEREEEDRTVLVGVYPCRSHQTNIHNYVKAHRAFQLFGFYLCMGCGGSVRGLVP